MYRLLYCSVPVIGNLNALSRFSCKIFSRFCLSKEDLEANTENWLLVIRHSQGLERSLNVDKHMYFILTEDLELKGNRKY